MPRLEFRIPIAPTPAFYSNVRLAAASLARLGEPYASARIVVSVGHGVDRGAIAAANPWSERYPIDWYAVPAEVWSRGGFEEGLFGDRFPETTTADIIIHSDADTCAVGRFDELIEALSSPVPRAAGCMAHFPPFEGLPPEENERRWRQIFRACGVKPPRFEHTYALVGPEVCGMAPPYLNAGFIAINRAGWEAVGPVVDRHTPTARALLQAYGRAFFAVQCAMTVTMAERHIDVIILGMEYNCPNDDRVLRLGLSDLNDIRIIHYQRGHEFDRHTFLLDAEAVSRFLTSDLKEAVNRKLQAHVRTLMGA